MQEILKLENAGWSDSVTWEITHFEGEPSPESFGVHRVTNGRATVTWNHNAFMVFAVAVWVMMLVILKG